MDYPVYANPDLRHDFVLLFDVVDGNPNGDPDAGNLPRVDPETMQGLVTDVAIKRKVRNYVDLVREGEPPYEIYIQNKGIALNTLHQRAYDAEGLKTTGSKQSRDDVDVARSWMCRQFFDVRMFGAVMTTGVNAGQVRGPVQITFARSVDPIVPLDVSITRIAITRPEDAAVAQDGEKQTGGKVTEMGRKAIVPYALYRAHGFYNPSFGRQTGCTPEDLMLFWEALQRAWDLDRSASRGLMACRGLYVFTHGSPLGDAPAHRLLERVTVHRTSQTGFPRSFREYHVEVDDEPMMVGDHAVEIVRHARLEPGQVSLTQVVHG